MNKVREIMLWLWKYTLTQDDEKYIESYGVDNFIKSYYEQMKMAK